MTVWINGWTNKGPAEVDANTLALRVFPLADDTQAITGQFLGRYAVGMSYLIDRASGGGWGNAVSNSPLAAFQWTSGGVICVLRKIYASVGQSSTATAGIASLQGFVVRGYTKQYDIYKSNGAGSAYDQIASNIVLGQGSKKRYNMPPSQMAGQVESNVLPGGAPTLASVTFIPGSNIVTPLSSFSNAGTNTITGLEGITGTLDAQPFCSFSGSALATAGKPVIPHTLLYEWKPTEHPVVFEAFTGFVIKGSLPGTSGIYQPAFTFEWDEFVAY